MLLLPLKMLTKCCHIYPSKTLFLTLITYATKTDT